MPLKFLRLPHLIQSEIMDNLLPEEMFLLSLCSQNSFKVLQLNFRKSTKLQIIVNVSTSLCARYYLNGRTGQFVEFLKDLPNLGRSFESVTIGGNRMFIHYDVLKNALEAKLSHDSSNVKLIMDHISRLFRRNVCFVELHGEPRTTLKRTSEKRKKETEVYSFGGSSFNGDDDWFSFTQDIPHSSQTFSSGTHDLGLEHFGNSSNRPDPISYDKPLALQTFNSLQIDLDLSKMISWDTVVHLNTNVAIPTDALKGVRRTIRIMDASFVTLDDLMNMDQVEIYLEKSKLTSADINSYLKSWMRNGRNSRLKFFQCEMTERVDERKIYEGLYVAKAEIKEYASLRGSISERSHLRFLPDFESQRSDGATVAGKCIDNTIALLFNRPKPGFKPRHPNRKRTTKYSIP